MALISFIYIYQIFKRLISRYFANDIFGFIIHFYYCIRFASALLAEINYNNNE